MLFYFKSLFSKKNLSPVSSYNQCPNCWGRQEWCGHYLEQELDVAKSLADNGQSQPAFIQRFVQRWIG